MEYQKTENLLGNGVANQPSKFWTKNWVERNDESKGGYTTGSDIKFKTTIIRSSLCDYADAYILVKRTIIITGGGDDAARLADERNKGVIFKNCAPFIKCISKINNTEIDNAQDINIVMQMYNLIEYSDKYSKTSGSLWQYYKDEPNDNLANSESFKSKIKITGKTCAGGSTKDVKIMVPLKYLSNFWGNLEMSLIITWSSTCVITNSTGKGRFKITDTKLFVWVVTLSIEDNAKLLQQLKPGFRRTINWNKYDSYPKTYAQNIFKPHSSSKFSRSKQTFCIIFWKWKW